MRLQMEVYSQFHAAAALTLGKELPIPIKQDEPGYHSRSGSFREKKSLLAVPEFELCFLRCSAHTTDAIPLILLLFYYLSLVTGLFFPVLLFLKQRRSPPLRLPLSDCSTVRIMCDVPSLAAVCSESADCFPGMASKCFCKTFVIISMVPIITAMIIHLKISCSTFTLSACINSYI